MNIDAHTYGYSQSEYADFLKNKLKDQGIYSEVIDIVVSNCEALINLKIDRWGIVPHFIFDARLITESTAIKINNLQKYLQPREILQWQSEGDYEGYPFKVE